MPHRIPHFPDTVNMISGGTTGRPDDRTTGCSEARERGPWRKARASSNGGGCVEVAPLAEGGIAVRDSKDPDGPVLRYTRGEWAAFLDGAKSGEFDDLA